MSDQVNIAANTLFPEQGTRVRDIKFFDLGQAAVSASDLAEQVNRAEAAIRHNRARRIENVREYLTE